MLLYADDIVLFADSADELQHGLNLLLEYCNWSLSLVYKLIHFKSCKFMSQSSISQSCQQESRSPAY